MIWPVIAVVAILALAWTTYVCWDMAQSLLRISNELCADLREQYKSSCGVILPPPPRLPREVLSKESDA